MQLNIREEVNSDIGPIHDLTAAAFGRGSIADLVDILRADDALLLSHVALLDGKIVGHAAYSLVSVTDTDSVHYCPALGPISVAPKLQRQGIGSALVRAGLNAMADAGYGLLFLVGSVSYYPRFGFQPALPFGFTSDYVQSEERHEHFMVAVLDTQQAGRYHGHVRFHPAFADAE